MFAVQAEGQVGNPGTVEDYTCLKQEQVPDHIGLIQGGEQIHQCVQADGSREQEAQPAFCHREPYEDGQREL